MLVTEAKETALSKREFQTESIDLASFLVAAGYESAIYRNPGSTRAVFEFTETDDLHQSIISYERGAALPAKKLLNCRSWLFREASRICREG